MTDGVLVVDKPAGMTSHDVVDHVRRAFRTRRVGHGGTLDPGATGVLIVGLGRATRLLSYTQMSYKAYRAVGRFGVTTSTQDAAGDVIRRRPADLTPQELDTATNPFLGDIEQLPPMVSAVKVRGERLYKKARRGEEIERKPRLVRITHFRLVDFTMSLEPEATFEIGCSSGTYVRTLIHDLGESLGCGAHLRALRRTYAGGFTDGDAVPLAQIERSHLRPMLDAVKFLGQVHVDRETAQLVRNGRKLDLAKLNGADVPPDGLLVAIVHAGELLGVYERKKNHLVAERVIPE